MTYKTTEKQIAGRRWQFIRRKGHTGADFTWARLYDDRRGVWIALSDPWPGADYPLRELIRQAAQVFPAE